MAKGSTISAVKADTFRVGKEAPGARITTSALAEVLQIWASSESPFGPGL